jgi:hypothetical protein
MDVTRILDRRSTGTFGSRVQNQLTNTIKRLRGAKPSRAHFKWMHGEGPARRNPKKVMTVIGNAADLLPEALRRCWRFYSALANPAAAPIAGT